MRPILIALFAIVLCSFGCKDDESAPKPPHKDKEAEVLKLQEECDHRVSSSCARLAHYYANGVGVEKDMGRANELYEVACSEGRYPERGACFKLANNFAEGIGVEKSMESARMFYKIGCDALHKPSCATLKKLR